MNIARDIILFEQGMLDDDAVVALFQELVDTGMAWQLQGSYGRTAAALIEAGRVVIASVCVCPECGRTFDLLDTDAAQEWYYGHDCEMGQ